MAFTGGAINECPGQGNKVWHEKDVYDVQCQNCGTAVEFWKDDKTHPCPDCGKDIANPRFAEDEE
jgi:rRNA maturation endonuclease Nob1